MFTKTALVVACALMLHWGVAYFSYSGEATPPMFGDYEAQRHWMELTTSLPLEEWYVQSAKNDLQYWGLDYPPLTAYHMWVCGSIARLVNPEFVQLNTSRGYESYDHKVFMRATVAIAEIVTFVPAVVCWCNSWLYAAVMLTYPGLILIDHGHFQYNCVSLGLALAAVAAIDKKRELSGALLFTLAVCYKQMELYHALPFFFYLLGKHVKRPGKVVLLGLVVAGTFAICLFPFRNVLQSVVHRLFPVARGVFEDKVANAWFAINLVVKLKDIANNITMAKSCLVVTATLVIPSCLDLLMRPSFPRFLHSLVNVSFVFYHFSFQVHEKSILLVALPVLLVFPKYPHVCLWFLQISTFSMFPLLLKDGLLLPTAVTVIVFTLVTAEYMSHVTVRLSYWFRICMFTSLVGCFTLAAAHIFIAPPARYPHLFPVLESAFSFVHFMIFALYFHWQQFMFNNKKIKVI